MLSFLAIKQRTFFRPIRSSRIGEYNTDRGDCTFQIDKYRWDFRTLFENHEVIRQTINGWEYFISPRKPLTKADVPHYANLDFDVRALACNTAEMLCFEAAYSTDFDYNVEDINNLTKGILYYADGNPATVSGNKYQTFDIVHSLRCDPNIKGDIKPNVFASDNGNGRHSIFIEWSHSEGCAQNMQTIPPDPPEEPDCKFKNFKKDSDLGIDVDFATLNNGPIGIRSYFMWSGQPKVLYYTPCGYSNPPFNAKSTGGEKYSSAWVCSLENFEAGAPTLGDCLSYGYEQKQPSYTLASTEESGVLHKLTEPNSGRETWVNWECEQTMPLGYVELDLTPVDFSDKRLVTTLDNRDVCLKVIPEPVPPAGFCKYEQTQKNYKGDEWKLNIDLYTLNKAEGYSVDTTLPTLPPQKKKLIVQPCGGLRCPHNKEGTPYHCDGDEFATVWLCDLDQGGVGATPTCDAFGLFNNQTSPEASMIDGAITNGLLVKYYGDQRRSAEFSIRCDEKGLSNQLTIDDKAVLDGTVLKISGSSKSACAYGNGPSPTPVPKLVPKVPKKGPTPTPAFNLRPDNDLFWENGTHFVYIDLETVHDDDLFREGILVQNRLRGEVKTMFKPWKKIKCPAGHTCEGGADAMANMWTCWTLNDIKSTQWCHNSADINMGVKMTTFNDGAMIQYEGGYGVGADIRLKCKFGKNVSTLSQFDTYVVYHQGMNGAEFEYSTVTELACTSKFLDPIIPKPTAKPAPQSYATTWKSPTVGGTHFSVNLADLPAHDQDIYLGYGDSFRKVHVYFSPKELIGCPAGHVCDGYASEPGIKAHSWLCFNTTDGVKACYEVGDARYGLEYQLNNESDINAGFHIEYDGGIGNYETWLQFWCNVDVPWGQMYWHPVAKLFGSAFKVTLEVESRYGCPANTVFPGAAMTGGAIFLLILFLGAAVYVIGFTSFNFFIKGEVAFPHANFWSNVFTNVSTAVVFIFTCGKGASIANSSYDKI